MDNKSTLNIEKLLNRLEHSVCHRDEMLEIVKAIEETQELPKIPVLSPTIETNNEDELQASNDTSNNLRDNNSQTTNNETTTTSEKSTHLYAVKDSDLEDYVVSDIDIKIVEDFDGNYIQSNNGTHL